MSSCEYDKECNIMYVCEPEQVCKSFGPRSDKFTGLWYYVQCENGIWQFSQKFNHTHQSICVGFWKRIALSRLFKVKRWDCNWICTMMNKQISFFILLSNSETYCVQCVNRLQPVAVFIPYILSWTMIFHNYWMPQLSKVCKKLCA